MIPQPDSRNASDNLEALGSHETRGKVPSPIHWDVVSLGETMLRLTPPNGGRLETAETLQSWIAGSESNTLAAMARLGLKVTWISALPDDPGGRRVAATLRSHSVDLTGVLFEPQARLGTFYAEETPAPLGPQVIYDRANSAFALADPDRFDLGAIGSAHLLHLTGITPALGAGPRALFDRALHAARVADVPVSLDVNYRARLWTAEEATATLERACRQARVLLCSTADAATLWHWRGEPEDVLREMHARFAEPGQPKTLVLTLGPAGAASWEDGAYDSQPTIACAGAHRFGSGDAFGAGFLAAWLRRDAGSDFFLDPTHSPLAVGNTLAALKRCIPGDIAIIAPDDLTRALGSPEQRFR